MTGSGAAVRNGLNFTERGFGVRPPLGCSDRANSAASQMRPGDVDWEEIFGRAGRALVSLRRDLRRAVEPTAELALEAMRIARRHGTTVSYDLNYRQSLWKSRGGPHVRAAEVNQRLVDSVDVLLGNEEDFSIGLGYELEGTDSRAARSRPRRLREHARMVLERNPEARHRRNHATRGAHRHDQ